MLEFNILLDLLLGIILGFFGWITYKVYGINVNNLLGKLSYILIFLPYIYYIIKISINYTPELDVFVKEFVDLILYTVGIIMGITIDELAESFVKNIISH